MTSLNKLSNAIAVSAFFALSLAPTASAQIVPLPLPLPVPLPSPQLVAGGNLWTITAYDDASPVHTQMATQGICFEFVGVVGTHTRYRWRSTTFPDWNGRATQEGDQIFMHGDYAANVGHDGMAWSIDTSKAGSGHWFEWREDATYGNTIVFANAVLQRTGTCPTTGVIPFVPPQIIDGVLQDSPIGRPATTEKEQQ